MKTKDERIFDFCDFIKEQADETEHISKWLEQKSKQLALIATELERMAENGKCTID